jgi:DNA-binding HxlR family transcriptional regulator
MSGGGSDKARPRKKLSGPATGRLANRECSIARAMDVIGDRWTLLVMREAYYGTTRFDEFEYFVGAAPNILSNRLKKLIDTNMVRKVPVPGHRGRYEYVLTNQGRAFFPAYLALKKWGDDWLSEPEGPQVVFVERGSGRPVKYPALRAANGKPLGPDDVDVVPGTGAVPFNRKRFRSASLDEKAHAPRREAPKRSVR